MKGNIWKFAIHLITNKRTYMTFLSIFFLTMPDATTKMVGLLTLVGQLAGFVFEVPSGYISDRIGHKNALVIARLSMVLSTACYIFANHVAWFFVGSILLAIGIAFVSGTGSAFMHNTLKALGRDNQYAKIMGRLKSLGFAIPIVFILLLPIIAETSFQTAFIVAFVIDLIGLAVVIIMKEPQKAIQEVEEPKPGTLIQNIKEIKSLGWLPYIILIQLISAISLGSIIGFKFPFHESIGFSISMLGVLWATSRVFISATLLTNGWVHRVLTYKQFIILRNTIRGLVFVAIGLSGNMWVIAILFIIGNTSGYGFSAAAGQYSMEFIGKSQSKATLISLKQLISKVISAGIGLLMGFMVFDFGYNKAYLVIGVLILLVVATAIAILPKFHPHEMKALI